MEGRIVKACLMSRYEREDESQWVQLPSPKIRWVFVLLLIPYSLQLECHSSIYGNYVCFEVKNSRGLQIFENLQRKVDPKVLENKTRAAEERERQHYENARKRFADLVCIGRLCTGTQLTEGTGWDQLNTTMYHILNKSPQCYQYPEELPCQDI